MVFVPLVSGTEANRKVPSCLTGVCLNSLSLIYSISVSPDWPLPVTAIVALLVAAFGGLRVGGSIIVCDCWVVTGELPRSFSTKRLNPMSALTPKARMRMNIPTIPVIARTSRRFSLRSVTLLSLEYAIWASGQNRTDVYGLRYRCSATELWRQ